MEKVRELKKELDHARWETQRLREERNSARGEADTLREERNLALTEMERVCKERDDTLQQIAPLLKQVEELKLERETSEALGRERQAMMRELIQRTHRV